ncbi:hypothetical protein R1sor_021866 [Riccia sorocarpa]|uniref:Uncharacterized protein n=1 Tax=Riccia sorocarpa TaxID=122646 RepID=A0ABD3GLJ4_9MARC
MSVIGVQRQNSWSRSSYRRETYDPGTGSPRDDRGWTPLHVAARLGDLSEVQRLLDEGADVNTPAWGPKAPGTTPLHLAAIGGHLHVMDELLERGANIEARTKGACGWTPLHSAAKERNKRAIRFLLENGAFLPPDMNDGRFNPPLHYCPGLEWAYKLRGKILEKRGKSPHIPVFKRFLSFQESPGPARIEMDP